MSPLRLLPRFARPLLFLALALVCAGGTVGCETFDTIAGQAFMIGPEQELQLGSEFRTEIEKELEFVRDRQVVDYVQGLGRTVVENAPEPPPFPVEFHVVKDPSINAFAIPGGNVYVHTGLLAAASDESEVLSVIAHEYGHVVYRHGAKHMARAQGMQAVSALGGKLLGDAGSSQLVGLGVSLFEQGALTRYGREDELEADSIAIPTLYRAGYDPRGMVSFFEHLQSKYGDQSGFTRYFSSHPATSERIDRAEEAIRSLPEGSLKRPDADLRRIQDRMRKLGLSE